MHVFIVLCLDYADPVALFFSLLYSPDSLSSSPIVLLHFCVLCWRSSAGRHTPAVLMMAAPMKTAITVPLPVL